MSPVGSMLFWNLNTPRTDAEGFEKPNNKRNFELILLKLHKKPPAVEQRERFFSIFAPDG